MSKPNNYALNSPENNCHLFQLTRRVYKGIELVASGTMFLNKANNTLAYLYFTHGDRTIIDDYVAIWKIKSVKAHVYLAEHGRAEYYKDEAERYEHKYKRLKNDDLDDDEY